MHVHSLAFHFQGTQKAWTSRKRKREAKTTNWWIAFQSQTATPARSNSPGPIHRTYNIASCMDVPSLGLMLGRWQRLCYTLIIQKSEKEQSTTTSFLNYNPTEKLRLRDMQTKPAGTSCPTTTQKSIQVSISEQKHKESTDCTDNSFIQAIGTGPNIWQTQSNA